jgi:hypothetical protein
VRVRVRARAEASAKAKAIDQSLRAARSTTAFGRAVLELWRAMRPKAKALGYLEATARATATVTARARATWFGGGKGSVGLGQ